MSERARFWSGSGRATAPESGAYPLKRMRPGVGAGLCNWWPHALCEKQVCAHTPGAGVCAQTCPRQGRGDSPLALNPSQDRPRCGRKAICPPPSP